MPRQTEPNANNALGGLLQIIRVPRKWHHTLDDGRLRVLSHPTAKIRRATSDLAQRKIITHATPSAKIEVFAHKLAESSKSTVILDGPVDVNPLKVGAEVFGPARKLTELLTHGT